MIKDSNASLALHHPLQSLVSSCINTSTRQKNTLDLILSITGKRLSNLYFELIEDYFARNTDNPEINKLVATYENDIAQLKHGLTVYNEVIVHIKGFSDWHCDLDKSKVNIASDGSVELPNNCKANALEHIRECIERYFFGTGNYAIADFDAIEGLYWDKGINDKEWSYDSDNGHQDRQLSVLNLVSADGNVSVKFKDGKDITIVNMKVGDVLLYPSNWSCIHMIDAEYEVVFIKAFMVFNVSTMSKVN